MLYGWKVVLAYGRTDIIMHSVPSMHCSPDIRSLPCGIRPLGRLVAKVDNPFRPWHRP
jgi:hypothetical protein